MNPKPNRAWCWIVGFCLFLCAVPLPAAEAPASAGSIDPFAWPAITAENRPWSRWWWLGSAVDKPNLTQLLEAYREGGLGGVEICPIYGAKGYEERYIDYLSPKWVEMLAHTTAEAKRLGMGVDLTDGTGWPYGGPQVTPQDASSKLVLNQYSVAGGAAFDQALPKGTMQYVGAVSENGEHVDLTANVKDGRVQWKAPPLKWTIYAVLASGPAQKVKRAAPGGEGNVVDPFSIDARPITWHDSTKLWLTSTAIRLAHTFTIRSSITAQVGRRHSSQSSSVYAGMTSRRSCRRSSVKARTTPSPA